MFGGRLIGLRPSDSTARAGLRWFSQISLENSFLSDDENEVGKMRHKNKCLPSKTVSP
jgi:hypothetical protein